MAANYKQRETGGCVPVWCKLGKVFFNWKPSLPCAFQSILHCIYRSRFILHPWPFI